MFYTISTTTRGVPMGPVWEQERHNWSTTQSSEFRSHHPELFGPGEQVHPVQSDGVTGWVTVPANGLSPDCEPVGSRCACGRTA